MQINYRNKYLKSLQFGYSYVCMQQLPTNHVSLNNRSLVFLFFSFLLSFIFLSLSSFPLLTSSSPFFLNREAPQICIHGHGNPSLLSLCHLFHYYYYYLTQMLWSNLYKTAAG